MKYTYIDDQNNLTFMAVNIYTKIKWSLLDYQKLMNKSHVELR